MLRPASVSLVLAVILTGCVSAPATTPSPEPTVAPAPPTATAEAAPQTPAAPPVVRGEVPVSVRIPAIDIDVPLIDLGIAPSGQMEAPVDYDEVGWFTGGGRPGGFGPTVIAGHVDSTTGPAVFFRLAELEVGDEVVVDTDTGRSLTFTVTALTQSAKATFPTADVYSTVPRPELRLITCAGVFDRSVGHYTDNLVVFAALAP
jgi:sortase (surface protein transpeptidase)